MNLLDMQFPPDPKTEPFPNVFMHQAMTPSRFERLSQSFPDAGCFVGETNCHGGRKDLVYSDSKENACSRFLADNHDWNELHKEVCNLATHNLVIEYFQRYLSDSGYLGGTPDVPDFAFSVAESGYRMPVHHDKRYHVAVLLIYFDTLLPGSGGDLIFYSCNRQKFISESPRFPKESEVSPCRPIQIQENTACLFLNTPNSYHSVSTLFGSRRFLYIAWNVIENTAWKVSSRNQWVPGDELSKFRGSRGFIECLGVAKQ